MTKRIPLTQGLFAIVDDEDFDALSKHKWCATREGRYSIYAVHWDGERIVRMHNIIMPPSEGMVIDHRDGNGLHNCRSNLREATRSQNNWNVQVPPRSSTGVRGVYARQDGKYQARGCKYGKVTNLGNFSTIEEAKAVRMAWVEANYGEFAGVH